MSVPVQLSLEANPVIDTDYAPAVVEAIVQLLDTANPAFRSGFVCSGYVFTFDEETGFAGIRQISPQVKTGPDLTLQDTNPGFVGTGGYNEQDDTP